MGGGTLKSVGCGNATAEVTGTRPAGAISMVGGGMEKLTGIGAASTWDGMPGGGRDLIASQSTVGCCGATFADGRLTELNVAFAVDCDTPTCDKLMSADSGAAGVSGKSGGGGGGASASKTSEPHADAAPLEISISHALASAALLFDSSRRSFCDSLPTVPGFSGMLSFDSS